MTEANGKRDVASTNEGRGRAELVLEIGRALLRLGAPAYRLEDTMKLLAQRLGLEGQFYCTPTFFMAALGRGSRQRSFMARVDEAEIHLGKLSRIHDVIEAMARHTLSPVAAIRQVREIMDAPPQYSIGVRLLAPALFSAAIAILFGGGVIELGVALLLGFLTGGLGMLMGPRPNLSRLYPALAGTIGALVVGVGLLWLPPFSAYLALVAGLIILMPGLSLTLATRELATGHLTAGSARMAGAMVSLVIIAFGVALGSQLAQMFSGPWPQEISTTLPAWTHWLAILAAGIGFTVLFNASPNKLGWIVLTGVLAVEVGGRVSDWLNPGLGALIAALLVGVLGNLYARIRNRPAVVIQVPGIMLIVPGSLGFRSLASMMDQDALGGVQIGFTVALVAAGIATGLILASALVPPRRSL
ncbi:threonine/serine exporter family protein [Natronospira bacteriovora]|uniref:Threonine/serine exporter family protein n=1 Tax=Natronospira bacteriovora TaxID=3069753 RepID=A0ABU0W5A3_9GAMM|nr:threonine/serine exporter family protein [Natronospira sp. AB-CW4]MDQ2069098.1 threonine/serine exporter family protein [Natronospira sp. AB-CW4]